MASGTWKSRYQIQFAYDAILAPIEDEIDIDEWEESGADPQYVDLPCYVPLIDDDGLEPFAMDESRADRH